MYVTVSIFHLQVRRASILPPKWKLSRNEKARREALGGYLPARRKES